MTTEFPSADDATRPDGSVLSEGLGPLVERIGSPPDTHCWDDDSAADCWSYSPQMVAELLDAAVAAKRERCAKACEPTWPRPCDCERCDCGNATDARMVAEWDAWTALARRIREA